MKIILKIVALLVLVAIAGVVYLAFNLGGIIKDGVEEYAPPLVGSPVTVSSVQILPLSGSGAIRGFDVGQPSGYGEGNIISVGTADISVDIESLTQDVVIIKSISIDSPMVHYIQKDNNNDNVRALMKAIEQNTGSSSSAGDTGDSGAGKKIIIDEFTLSNMLVKATSPLLGDEDFEVILPTIRLTEIGRKSGGQHADELARDLGRQLTSAIKDGLANSSVFQDQIKQRLMDEGQKRAEEEINKQLGEQGGSLIKGLFNK
ncbi:MAG: hypothetical protein V7744_17630 [Pseudomonadales bacterium]